MRKLFFGAFVIVLALSACKTQRTLPKQETAPTETVSKEEPATKVFSAPATQPAYQQPAPATRYESSTPVRAQSESFTYANQGDAGKYAGKFFVIIEFQFHGICKPVNRNWLRWDSARSFCAAKQAITAFVSMHTRTKPLHASGSIRSGRIIRNMPIPGC